MTQDTVRSNLYNQEKLVSKSNMCLAYTVSNVDNSFLKKFIF